jgi:hypothetical protein
MKIDRIRIVTPAKTELTIPAPTLASAAEQRFALALIDAARDRGLAVRAAIMDKGYDSGPIHDGCMDRDVCPVTALASTGRVKAGEHKPPRCEHGEWTFAGADFKRKATKWRCPTGECQPKSRWIKADRQHPLIPREFARSRALYRSVVQSSASSDASSTNGRSPRSVSVDLARYGSTPT